MNDLYFRVPALKVAQLHYKNNSNAYLYYWTYPSSNPDYGACHAIELPYVFNNFESDDPNYKTINYKLVEITQDMWANFAKNGNPSTKEINREKFDDNNEYCMVFGKEVELKTNLFNKKRDNIILHLLEEYIPYQVVELNLNVPIIRKGI